MTRRRVGLLLFGLGLSLVALEVLLQILAFVVWMRSEPLPPAASDGPGTILCVGDSFTYGLGAHDRERSAYPAVLQRELGATRVVVNAGKPGFDSADVLARLPALLSAYRPQRVVLLVGYNDFWSAGEAPAPADDGFPLQWRTRRLFRLMWAAMFGDDPEQDVESAESGAATPQQEPLDQAPFLGPWHAPEFGTWFEFRRDGSLHGDDGPLDALWSWRDGAIETRPVGGGEPQTIRYALRDDVLELDGGPFPPGVKLQRGLPSRDAFDRARQFERDGDHAAAEREWRRASEEASGPRALRARRRLVRLLAKTGRPAADIDAALRGLSESYAADPNPAVGRALLGALLDARREAAAMRHAAELLQAGPIDDGLVEDVIHHAKSLPDAAPLLSAIKTALDKTANPATPRQRAGLLGVAAQLDPQQPLRAARALVALLEVDGVTGLEQQFALRRDLCTAEQFDAAVAERGVSPERAAEMRAAFDSASEAESGTEAGLAASLMEIVQLCRDAGAEPLLLTYPIERRSVQLAVAKVGESKAVPFVDVLAEFRRRAGSDYESLFVLDGHCNDRGYELLGEIVAGELARSNGR